MIDYSGKNAPKLGFGLMRLPKTADGRTDIEQTKEMVDIFMENGFTYFDTAYVYDGGGSENAVRVALTERYPRESFTLATKLCAWMGATDEASAKQQFYTSLKRTGAGYFDYYLLHALQRNNYKKYDEYHIWDFVKELKAEGLIKNYGFSFHADPQLFERLLESHPDVDFVQLQINYADWENPGVQAHSCYEIARKYGKPIVVMEPVKGGVLANPPKQVADILKAAEPDASPASWAIRYAASLEGVMTVLSGMSDTEQMRDNVSFMKAFKPLSAKEQEVIERAQAAFMGERVAVACTGCNYCAAGCPKHIPISEIFHVMNHQKGNAEFRGVREYVISTTGRGKASDCIECGKCEKSCPQHLYIRKYLKEASAKFESD